MSGTMRRVLDDLRELDRLERAGEPAGNVERAREATLLRRAMLPEDVERAAVRAALPPWALPTLPKAVAR